jgi:glucosyl-3-phosphoglycerate phosphatase
MTPGTVTPRIHLFRHGESTFNASWDAFGLDPGHPDAGLTDLGHEQVRLALPDVRELDAQVIITSPARRALQTTLGLFPAFQSRPPVVVEPLARDRFAGDSCDYGRSSNELAAEFPELDFAHLAESWWWPTPDGVLSAHIESPRAFARRVEALRARLLSRCESSILVVAHQGTFRRLAGVQMANGQLLHWTPSLSDPQRVASPCAPAKLFPP